MADSRIEPVGDADPDEVLAAINAAFGFERGLDWFEWKHRDGPWGASEGLVARDDNGIVGVRLLLPWKLALGDGGGALARRAVEAATVPRARGRGIFSALNRELMEHAQGSAEPTVLFSTPNRQSEAGYAKLGWAWVGPVPHVYRLRPLRSWRAARLRQGDDVLRDYPETRGEASDLIRTVWSRGSLAWRVDVRSGNAYGAASLEEADQVNGLLYRVVSRGRYRLLMPLTSWGDESSRRALLGSVASRERAAAILETGLPGGALTHSGRGWRRGGSRLAVWWSDALADLDAQIRSAHSWHMGFADLEGVL